MSKFVPFSYKKRHPICPPLLQNCYTQNINWCDRFKVVSYKIDIQILTDFLRVNVSGTRQPGQQSKDAREMWVAIARACQRYQATHVLCVAKLIGPLPPMEAYGAANTITDLFRGTSIKIAYVLIDEGSAIKSNSFGETVALNRGFHGKMFLSEQEAIDWLIGPQV